MTRTEVRNGELTLHEVQNEDTWGDGLGGHLDPPLEEEREQQHSDQTFPSQSCPGTLWFGFAERWSWGEEQENLLHSFIETMTDRAISLN